MSSSEIRQMFDNCQLMDYLYIKSGFRFLLNDGVVMDSDNSLQVPSVVFDKLDDHNRQIILATLTNCNN